MKIYITLFIVAFSFACSSNQTASSNAEKTTYTPQDKLDRTAEQLAEQEKHDKWKREREAQLKKFNEMEAMRLAAIRRCEADKLKKPADTNSDTDDAPKAKQLSCEEQHPPIFERDAVSAGPGDAGKAP